ncbi:MAG: M23 family metallopeptidase [Pseudomonadota bacterium]
MRRALAALTFALAPVSGAGAFDFKLAWPMDCTLGEDCFIQQYVDRDPGPGTRDYTCGPLTYDGHKGTDIRLALENELGADAPQVLAAAPGVVVGIRNDMPEGFLGRPGAPSLEDVAGKECGNGVVLDHGFGWVTQYCHMAQYSVAVEPGDEVDTGTALGQIGASGATEFPHLHLSVRKDGETVDPFVPDPSIECSTLAATDTLWTTTPAYQSGVLLSVGSLDRVPDFNEVKRGLPPRPTAERTAPLVLYGYAFGALPEDAFRFVLTGPDGTVFDRTVLLEKTQAQVFRAFGRRAPPDGWAAGQYQGEVTYRRDGQVIDRKEIMLRLTP